MKILFVKGLSVLAISILLLAGCQNEESSQDESDAGETDSSSAAAETDNSSEEEEQTSEGEDHIHEDEHEHDEDEHSHDHSHEQDEDIYAGYFEDSQVEDRPLSDWEGDWQSVYPYLLDGTLDEVFEHKEEHDGDKTAEEYKEYYDEGYETEVDRIVMDGNKVTFYEDGEENSGEYSYDGYEILTYEAGNRGVRYIFALEDDAEGLPQYIQFSDHSIYPTEADHYHLYWGDDREALLEEVTNWPTYYPSDMDGHDIAHEMMAH
ncbi:zinc transport system substrate-binding protein [Gracilibacillus orientalis]|uniref:Zinc transport system substrate-binding protein n=1 Tax=Gracilibacillus orientalis TaxID=334253 RepID=A0A1I4HSI6_9BACI|nr:metal-binding protein ZinT [Gracilibacillus orientalis]SFL44770.1 zinc transport system substrate-binding protein [Gracilibacillus orientalis]